MNRFAISFLLLSLCFSSPAFAALKVGDTAPDFTAKAAIGGKTFDFKLSDALKKGPVVLYFFPKAFTSGCTIEAHDFAEAADKYKAAGAMLIGMSADTIETETDFSSKECRDKFPVAADPDMTVIKAYDASMISLPGHFGVSDRISYVIGPDDKILYVYSALAPGEHVANTLAVVQQWHNRH